MRCRTWFVASLWLAACAPGTSATSDSGSTSTGGSDSKTSTSHQSTTTGDSTGTGNTSAGTATDDSATMDPSTTSATEKPYCRSDSECGELSTCSCSCDFYDGCCQCKNVECTSDDHCTDGEICLFYGDDHGSDLICGPEVCEGRDFESHLVPNDDAVYLLDEVTCAWRISLSGDVSTVAPLASLAYVAKQFEIDNTAVTTLGGLESLREVDELVIQYNPELSDVSGLSGLEKINSGGVIRDNPKLPTAEIEAILAGVEGGAEVVICNNLDGLPC